MSAVASKATVAAPAAAPAEVPEIEDAGDRKESLIQYDPTSKVPIVVVLVWVCALVGLGAYTITWLLPELALWGKP
jgi:hypothetical protein